MSSKSWRLKNPDKYKQSVKAWDSSRTPTYNSWRKMRERCNNPNQDYYENYGGTGVKVCSRWDSFKLFLEDMGERPSGMTLDRKDPYGDYTPDNCRWADASTQNKNKRKKLSVKAAA